MTTSIIVLIISGLIVGWANGDKDKRYSSGFAPVGFFKTIISYIGAFIMVGAIIGIIVNW